METAAQATQEQIQHGIPKIRRAREEEIPSARCAVMTVAYLRRMGDLAPPEVHGIEVVIPGEAADAVVLCIDRDFFRRKANEALAADVVARLVEPVGHCVAADPLMRGVANALRSELRSQSAPSAAFLESLAGVIAIHLARNNYGSRPALRAGPGLAPDKLQRVLAFIEQHPPHPVRIERLAAAGRPNPVPFPRPVQ